MSTLDALGEEYRTRPETPMIGPYSVNQMDDFYAALADGEMKPTGIMNYLQRLLITERCRPGARVLDVCCGRGLQLPVLNRYRPDIAEYVGLDISADNLAEATDRQATVNTSGGTPSAFHVTFHVCDVAGPWPNLGLFDVAVYTSALEHLPRDHGIASLRHTAAALTPAGRLYLSTPNTPGDPPRKLQHRVHVYEWSHQELTGVLDDVGLVVDDVVGILPPSTADHTVQAIRDRFGARAAAFYNAMREFAPAALLGPVVATALGEAATEILYICSPKTRMNAQAVTPYWVSVEGPNGVGKTYLTRLLTARLGERCRVLAELTDASGEKVPAQVIAALSTGTSFLRTGHPITETFALMALKVREFETIGHLETAPQIVVEDRGIDTVALYQAAILRGPDSSDDEIWAVSQHVHATVALWRPLPIMTLLILDDSDACLRRYERRVGFPMTDEKREFVTRVARLYRRQADHEPGRFRTVHRDGRSDADIAAQMHRLVLSGMGGV